MDRTLTDRAHWSRVAADWVAWAGTPGHDAFWGYRAALGAFIGPGHGSALEIGCGEGRIARLLGELGWRVTATDGVAAMVAAAREARSAAAYAVADAARLPVAEGSFALVVAYNVLMDVDDTAAVVREMRRVLAPGGTVLISLVHPVADRGRFAGPEPGAPFQIAGSLFGREPFDTAVEVDGLAMHFSGWSQPLETYADALADAGLAITAVKEPRPDLAAQPRLRQWDRIPLFLWLKARPLAG